MYKIHFTREITLQVALIVNTEQLQHYVPYTVYHRNMVCFRYITVNNLHKVDNKDDDDDDDDDDNDDDNNNNNVKVLNIQHGK